MSCQYFEDDILLIGLPWGTKYAQKPLIKKLRRIIMAQNRKKGWQDMRKYLYETHCHTSETSNCGKAPAADVVRHYKELGYDGIAITDHMHRYTFRKLGSNATREEKTNHFLAGYREAKKYEDENFSVILGMEIRCTENDNDYLVYGFDEDFVDAQYLSEFSSLEEIRKMVDDNNLILYQAHPFREGMVIVEPRLLDGTEVYNGHGGHDSRNEIAWAWAEKYNLPKLSGSDFHGETLMETGGIYLPERVTDSRRFCQLLKEGKYELKAFTKP